MQRYGSFGAFMRTEFGFTVYKVNVDAGFTCPNRDGTLGLSGCIYCNNDSFRPNSCKPALSLGEQISNGITYIRKRYKANKFIVYFQPYTNTYAPLETLRELYTEALRQPDVIGLAIGTRPDAIDEEKIRMFEEFAARRFILLEYGLQSIYDKSLAFINRGHDYAAFLRAVDMTKDRGIHIGAHIIAGFPTETREEMLAMAEEISSLPIGFLKVHQLQVIKDTPLADMYRKKPFHTFAYEEYLDFIVDFIERTSPGVVFQRLFATAPGSILIAPDWGRNRHQILSDVEKKLDTRDTHQGSKYRLQSALHTER
ncbi:MAG: TIGR01212 family radical SAM protein [Nitrospira bacterium HGW-Nitrospira-1]|nr:MAG: TIGR01212 family radical SAM protein [Nitrospira bacterium HGW-Nitrospira-1]